MIAGKGQNTREISIKGREVVLGEAKTSALLGLHATSGTDWGHSYQESMIQIIFTPGFYNWTKMTKFWMPYLLLV